MENSSPAVGVGLENENSTDAHTPDKLLSVLKTTSVYICNIETSNDGDALLKDSLKSDFKTINDLLIDAVTRGISVDKAEELQLSDSPIRLAEGYKEIVIALIVFYHIYVSKCGRISFSHIVLHSVLVKCC